MSEFMKDIADQAKRMPAPVHENELDILSRSVKSSKDTVIEAPVVIEIDEKDIPLKKPKTTKKVEEIKLTRSITEDPIDKITEEPIIDSPVVHTNATDIVPESRISLNEAAMLLEQLTENIVRLESQISKVMELVENNTKKYPFPEGATATNHTTGQQIVFSRGQWWYLDDKQ